MCFYDHNKIIYSTQHVHRPVSPCPTANHMIKDNADEDVRQTVPIKETLGTRCEFLISSWWHCLRPLRDGVRSTRVGSEITSF